MMNLLVMILEILVIGLAGGATGAMIGMMMERTGIAPWTVNLSQKIRSLGAWIRQGLAKGMLLIGTLLTRKGMNLLMKEGASSPLSSDNGDPFDDFVTRYLEKHG